MVLIMAETKQNTTSHLADAPTVREIVAASGLTQRAFAERFAIPLRTVENWCTGQRECPVYTRLMMQECLGLLHRCAKEESNHDA